MIHHLQVKVKVSKVQRRQQKEIHCKGLGGGGQKARSYFLTTSGNVDFENDYEPVYQFLVTVIADLSKSCIHVSQWTTE